MSQLSQDHCRPIRPEESALNELQISDLLDELKNSWQYDKATQTIWRKFSFRDYYQTLSFVNAAAWIAHQQDHHPEIRIHYNHSIILFSTHSINGLSHNDFICAARINQIADQ